MLTQNGHTGLAVVYPRPDAGFAIEMTTLTWPGAPTASLAADLAAARPVAGSIIFPEVK